MLANYTIVSLYKNKYNPEHISDTDDNPRLLVIRVYDRTDQYIIRYPDGQAERINSDWIKNKGTFDLTHPSYEALAKQMLPTFEYEFRRNQVFQTVLETTHPALALFLKQTIDAKNREHYLRNAVSPITIGEQTKLPTVEQPKHTDDKLYQLQCATISAMQTLTAALQELSEYMKGAVTNDKDR